MQAQLTLHHQRGIATLLVAVIMLMTLGMMTLYTNRSIIIEQRTTNNAYKHALALEAAQSGVAQFMGQLTATTIPNFFTAPVGSSTAWTLSSGLSNTVNANGYLNSAGAFSHNFTTATAATVSGTTTTTLPLPKKEDGSDVSGLAQTYQIYLVATATPSRFRLISRGCADACTYAEAFVVTDITIGNTPNCPIDINGNLNVTNTSSIHGMTNNVSGFDCGISVGSMSGTTSDVIGCITQCSTNPYTPPVSQTGGTTQAAHFKKYFGNDMATVKGTAATTCVVSGPITINSQPAWHAATNSYDPFPACAGSSIVYIEGNLTINAGIGPLYTGVNKSVIVSGDLNLNANTLNMQGFLYVAGNTISPLTGTITILGGAAFGGNVTTNMSFNVTADPNKSRTPAGGGLQANLNSATWRDF